MILLHCIGNRERVSQEQTAVSKERRRLARVAGLGRASVRGPGNPPSFDDFDVESEVDVHSWRYIHMLNLIWVYLGNVDFRLFLRM